MSEIIQVKLVFLGALWMVFSPFYMMHKDFNFTPKNIAICFAPAILFAVWFLVFYWG